MHEISDEDLLLPFEKHVLREPYRQYVRVKRNNRFATIQALPKIWTCFVLLDAICERELQDLYQVIDPAVPLPLSLFMGSFLRMRVAFELGFSGCVGECADLMRGAIEYAVQAKRIAEHPGLAEIWLNKDKGKGDCNAYREAFERKEKERLFKGLDALHHYWGQFSEWGSHSTKAALALRVRLEEGEGLKGSFEFFEVDHARLSKFLLMLIDAGHRVELLLFESFRIRLNLDVGLVKIRLQFERAKEEAEATHRQ